MKNNKTKIIAEIGVNHNGDINRAINLINMAASLGQILLNFKLILHKNSVTKNANLTRIKKNTKNKQTTKSIKKYEFSFSEFSYLKNIVIK